MNEYERAQKTIAASRAELDAAKAANAALKANHVTFMIELDKRIASLDAAVAMAAHAEAERNEQIATLKEERDEARGAARLATDAILRHAPHIKPVYLTGMIDSWDASHPAPDTNRDAGDESEV